MLLGSEIASLHPDTLEKAGDLKVMKSQFGTGYLVTGTHDSIKVEDIAWPESVSAIRQGRFKLVESDYVSHKQVITVTQTKGEELGVYCPKRCLKCKGCTDCAFSTRMLSDEEQFEYNLIEKGVEYNEVDKVFDVKYPFLKDPKIALTNNFRQAAAMAERLEKTLKKQDFVSEFNKEFARMVEKRALVELTQLEIDQWDGPVHYIPLQLVHNPESVSTPFRVVTNSSCPDPVTRESLNSIMAKGPNCLSDQWEVLVRFRNYESVLTSDVSKAYHSMRTGLVEKHLRRVLWRDCDGEQWWRIYAYIVVSYGDRAAAALLEITIKRTVELFGEIDKEAAEKIRKDRFVDDVATGGTREQVKRFVGNTDHETLQCDGTVRRNSAPDTQGRGTTSKSGCG